MATANLFEQSTFPQELSQYQINHSLYKLQLALINHQCTYLTNHRRMYSLQASSYIQNERLGRLDWGNPGHREWETVSFIKREMKAFLRDESLHGREVSPRQLLMDVSSHLWTYFLIFREGRGQRATCRSRYHDQEWGECSLRYRTIIDDCEAVTHILQQETKPMQEKGIYEALNRILRYLEQRTRIWRSGLRDAQPTSSDDPKEVEELDWELR